VCQFQSEIFNVAKTAELLQSPWRHSRVTVLYQETTDKKEMFVDIHIRQAEKKIIGCQTARSSIRVM